MREVLTSNDVRSGVDFGSAPGPLGRMSTWAGRRAPIGPLTPPSLLVTEPPDHTRYRKLVTRVFSARAVQQLRSRTEQIATELLDDLSADAQAGRPVDLVERYCALLPVTVIAEILGVPANERDRVLRFGAGAAPSLDLGLGWRDFREVEASLEEFDGWLSTHLEAVRRSPGTDLLSQLVTARDEDGRGLDDAELKATAGLVLAAGFETTVNLLGNGIWLLHEHPEQLDALREDPELWTNAVDEVLRHDPPVLLTGRTVVRDTELAGISVPRGAVVTTLLAGRQPRPRGVHRPGPLRRRPWPTRGTTCPSRQDATTASARRWPGWRARSVSGRSSTATPTWSSSPGRTGGPPASCGGGPDCPRDSAAEPGRLPPQRAASRRGEPGIGTRRTSFCAPTCRFPPRRRFTPRPSVRRPDL